MQFLEKTMGNVRKHGDIKIVTTERRKNYLVSVETTILQSFLQKMF